jgi:hypothetical protein
LVGEVRSLHYSPVDEQVFILLGTHDIAWMTTDCGASFNALVTGRPIDEV